MRRSMSVILCAAPGALWAAPAARAQQGFPIPGSSPVRERLAGDLFVADGGPQPEAGDQLGALFGDQVVGRTVLTDADLTSYDILVFGDDPATSGVVEGPGPNQVIIVQFFDSSTDTIRSDVRLENAQGEAVTYRYSGEEIPDLPIDLPGLDLTPVRNLNLRLGASGNDQGGDGGDGGSGIDGDVDGDGFITTNDAAVVLRIVSMRSPNVTSDEASRADVNGDGVISTADAIAILRIK